MYSRKMQCQAGLRELARLIRLRNRAQSLLLNKNTKCVLTKAIVRAALDMFNEKIDEVVLSIGRNM